MATPIEKVTKIMEESNLPYFTISHNSTILYRQTEEMEPKEAAAKLTDFIEGLDYTYVDVKISDRSPGDKAKGGKGIDYTHRIRLTDDVKGARPGEGGNLSLLREIAQLNLKIVELGYKQELKALEDKINKLSTEEKNPMQEAALGMLLKLFGNDIGVSAPAAPVVNGHEESAPATTEVKAAAQNRIKNALFKIKKIDPNFIETLEMIAQFAENKPEQYKSFIPIIKSQL